MPQRRKTTIGRNPLDVLQQNERPASQNGEVVAPGEVAVDDASRGVFGAWMAATEQTLRATFDVQNAAQAAGLATLDAAAASGRGLVEEWRRRVEQAQQSTLEAFRSSVRA